MLRVESSTFNFTNPLLALVEYEARYEENRFILIENLAAEENCPKTMKIWKKIDENHLSKQEAYICKDGEGSWLGRNIQAGATMRRLVLILTLLVGSQSFAAEKKLLFDIAQPDPAIVEFLKEVQKKSGTQNNEFRSLPELNIDLQKNLPFQ